MEKRLLLQELADLLAAREGITKKKADAFTRCFFEVVERGLETDKFVKIKGFGTFKIVSVSDRESVNINTGERFQISGHSKITFTPDAELRDLINRPFAHFQTVVLNESTNLADLDAVDAAEENGTTESQPDAEATDTDIPEEGNDPVADQAEKPMPQRETSESASEPDAHTEETASLPAEEEMPEEISSPAPEKDLPEEENDTEEQETEALPAEENSPDTDVPPAIPLADTMESRRIFKEEAEPDIPVQEMEDDKEDEKQTEPAETEEEETPEAPATDEGNAQADESPHAAQSAGQQEGPSQQQSPFIVSLPPAPVPEKFNWWKAIAMFFIVLLLMVLSYFAGYFRLFCPCEFMDAWQTRAYWTEAPEMQAQSNTTQRDTIPEESSDTIVRTQPDSSSVRPPAKPHAEVPAKVTETPMNAAVAPPAPAPAKPKATAPPVKPAKKPAPPQGFAQVPGGKYRIVGTRQKYTVSSGETVRSIAEYVYGSKGYAPYIITHNHLRNPNSIAAGSTLLLPELEVAE